VGKGAELAALSCVVLVASILMFTLHRMLVAGDMPGGAGE
jgi:hypothetical protein